ncbi:MAG: phage virion morphogenesis protein [Desulfocapsa sp.]|nr:MAG: phage virion morphogenesis protein [Desulfocapsa sp.]
MGDFSFTVDGFEKASAKIGALNLSHAEARELMRAIGEETDLQTTKHFETGSGPEGKWPKLSEATKKINPKRRSGHPLSNIGRLKGSISLSYPNSFTAIIGTNVHYAKYHQWGPRTLNMFGRGIRATLPRRMFLGWSPAEAAKINRIVANYLTRRAK